MNTGCLVGAAKPPGVDTDGFAFSPINAFGAAFSGGAGPGAVLPWSDQESIQLRPLTFYGLGRMYAKAQPRTQKNAGSTWHSLPARLVMKKPDHRPIRD